MDPMQLECDPDADILRLICSRFGSLGDSSKERIYLDIEENGVRSTIRFPAASLKSIESSEPLPFSFFELRGLDSRSEGINVDPRWIPWVKNGLSKGRDLDEMFRTMYDRGVEYDAIVCLLGHRLSQPITITERDDRETIEPMAAAGIDSRFRLDSDYVELYRIDGFLDQSQCEYFEGLVGNDTRRSVVYGSTPVAESRTSRTYYFANSGEVIPEVRALQRRVCSLLGSDMSVAEPMACLVYEKSEQFRAHQDYFDDQGTSYKGTDGLERRGQRQWSVLIYLRDVEAGSGTRFHRIRQEFTPHRGTALLWNNLYPSGSPNPYTHHVGLMVGDNKKLVLTQMFRQFAG